MPALAELHRAVTAAVASKRLGTVVFVRCTLQGMDAKTALPRLAQTVVAVREWVGQKLDRVHAISHDDGGQVAVTLQFAGGATALVSFARGRPRGDGVELLVLGNHGSLLHDAGQAELTDDPLDSTLPAPDPALVALLGRAVKSGKPEVVAEGAAMSEARYGVLLVTGSHTHQENYAAAFAADKRARLIALTDEPDVDKRRRELNERLARALGVPHIADIAEALKRKDVDLVSVCAEPDRRGRIAVRCAEAGKHLYLDKSLCPKLSEADAIVAAVKKSGVKSHMFSFITQPWARQAKELVDTGRLGKLVALHADAFFAKGKTGTAKLGKPRKEEYPPERQQLLEAKRELDNVGVYPLTLVRWLTGKRYRSVYAATGNYFFAEHQKHDVEDFGLLSATLEDGTLVTVAAGRYGWTTHPGTGRNRITLVGTKASATLDANRPRLEVYTDEMPWTAPNVNPEDPMGFWQSTQDAVHVRPKKTWLPLHPSVSDAAYFLDCLDAGRDSEMSAAEAAVGTEVLLAAYRSAAQREVVPLPLPR